MTPVPRATGVSAIVRLVAQLQSAATGATTLDAAAAAVVDTLGGGRLYTVEPGAEPVLRGGARPSTVDPIGELFATANGHQYVALCDREVAAFGGQLTEDERFAWAGSSLPASMMDTASLVALAAAVRAGLLAPLNGSAAGPDDVLRLLEAAVADRAAGLEQTVARQRADGRLIDTLRVVGQRLTAQLDLDLLVQEATDAATTATGAQFGAFFYNKINEYGESYMLYTLSGVPRAAFEGFPMPRNTAVFSPTFNGEGTVRSPDILADPRYGKNAPYYGMPGGHLPVRSYLAVPVISPTSQEVLGGFFFGHSDSDRFTEAHERLAEGIAGYAAIGLDNARLYASQRALATELQRSMLPTIANVPGFTVVGRYLPAATGSEVGGDWLDVIELPGGRTAFVIGDVMGRGVPAASTMGQMRTAVRAYAMLDLPPAEVLRHASQLAMAMPGRQFVTCVYAVHDPVESTLRYANAGHPPPAMISRDGTVSFLRERLGMPLRVGDVFQERVVDFPAGSAIVLYTDGLVERRGRPLPEGITQLETALAGVADELDDPTASCDKLIDGLTGGDHDDDVALLFVRDSGIDRRVAVLPLTAELAAGSQARRFASARLAEWEIDDPAKTIAIVVTELVSNAVRHSRQPIAMRLHHLGDRLVVEVMDADDRPPRPTQPNPHDENHRGLYIVDSLTQRWGSRPTTQGKVVWAEVALPAG